ncbi:MAG: hypothetical protein ACRD3W_01690, partial [Terriglobales bacterium]
RCRPFSGANVFQVQMFFRCKCFSGAKIFHLKNIAPLPEEGIEFSLNLLPRLERCDLTVLVLELCDLLQDRLAGYSEGTAEAERIGIGVEAS